MQNELNWHTSDDEPGEIRAESTVFHDEGTPLQYVVIDGEVWTASLDGCELATGTIADCIGACETDDFKQECAYGRMKARK